jgi:hypothetical protein
LLDVAKELASELKVQFIIATHSPLVLASVEPFFDSKTDKLFHLDLIHREVSLNEIPFIRRGQVNEWLRSEVFGLIHARSIEGEQALEDAKKLQTEAKPQKKEIINVTDRLKKYLSETDEFWPRWKYFAETHGVKI